MTSLVSASVVATGQVQSLDSVRAHALPSDALIFASGTKVQPANQNLGSYAIVESGVNSLGVTTTGSVPAVTQSPFADLYKEGSIYFSGATGNYLQNTATFPTFTWSSTGMTVEAWVNYTTFTNAAQSGTVPTLIGFMNNGTNNSFSFGANNSGVLIVYYYNGGSGVTLTSTGTLSVNTWNHIVFCCSSTPTATMYLNGTQVYSAALSGSGNTNINGLTIGQYGVNPTVYVADIRITSGTPLYTGSSFTVPSGPLGIASSGTTQFLLRAGQNAPTTQNGALTFDRGLKQFLNFGPQTFNIVTQGFTLIWKGQFTGTAGNYETIFQAGLASTNNGALFLGRAASAQSIIGWISASSGTTSVSTLGASTTIVQGTTYIVVWRYNPFTQIHDIWVNGNQAGSTSLLTSTLVADRLLPTTYVGVPYAAQQYLSASSNTLAVYNRALSNVEIYNSYLALTTNTINAPIEIGDVNGTPALSIAGDGRVNVTKLGQTSNVLPWPPAAMTGYDTLINGGIYKARASSENGSTTAWGAFDKTVGGDGASNTWKSNGGGYNAASTGLYTGTYNTTDVNGTVYPGEWLQIQTPNPVVLTSYQIYTITSGVILNCPRKWTILGSKDGINWVSLNSQAGITSWVIPGSLSFSVASVTQSYSYFRLSINEIQTAVGVFNTIVGDLVIYGTTDTAQQLTVSQPMTLSYGAQTASLTGISGDKYVPQDFSSSGLNIPAYVVSNTATTANTVQYSSFGPFAGEGSLYFGGGTSAYVNFGTSSPPNFSAVGNPFTWEAWVYITGSSSDAVYYNIIGHGSVTVGSYDYTLTVYNGTLYFSFFGLTPVNVSIGGFAYNTWNHVSGSWSGSGAAYVSINGTVNSATLTGTPAFTSSYLFTIGASSASFIRGYIACARVVRGAALYITSFTPPTGPLQPIQGVTQAGLPYGTVLLLRNAPAPGRVLTQKFGGANSGSVLSFPPAAMTGYSSALSSGYGQGTYVASSSSENSGFSPWYAFDKSASTFFHTAITYNATITDSGTYTGTVRTVDVNGTSYSGEWLQIQLASSIALSNYSMTGRSGLETSRTPRTFWVLGSRDGTSWFLVDSRSGINNWSSSPQSFSTSSVQAFTYFRMVIYQVGNASSGTTNEDSCQIAEWVLNGIIEGPNVTPDGRLGVGVSNPVQALEVAGNMIVNGTVSMTGGLTMFKNQLINGDMRIMQRGAPAANLGASSAGVYTLDRWWVSQPTTASNQISQVASGLPGFQYAARIQRPNTSGNTTLIALGQSIETVNTIPMQGQPMTLSFWARTAPSGYTGTFSALMVSGTGTDQSPFQTPASLSAWTGQTTILSASVSATTNWTQYSYQFLLPATATEYEVLFMRVGAGTAGTTDYLDITGVQLEKGTVATPFEVRPYATELALCQRYYTEIPFSGSHFTGGGTGGGRTIGSLAATNGSVCCTGIYFPVSMRINPTPNYYGAGTSPGVFTFYTGSSGAQVAVVQSTSNVVTAQISTMMLAINISTTSIIATGGSSGWFDMGWGSTSLGITLSAEL